MPQSVCPFSKITAEDTRVARKIAPYDFLPDGASFNLYTNAWGPGVCKPKDKRSMVKLKCFLKMAIVEIKYFFELSSQVLNIHNKN